MTVSTVSIPTRTLFHLPWSGYITLQIPQYILDISIFPDFPPPRGDECSLDREPEKCPIDWFSRLNSKMLPSSKGFLYWSRKGWEENKERIKKVYMEEGWKRRPRTPTPEEGWTSFEEHVEKHFSSIEMALKKRKRYLKEKIKEIDNFRI